MAYVDTQNTSARAPAVIGVAAIHAAIGVVLVLGLAAKFTPEAPPPPFSGGQIPLDPPPPPPEPEITPTQASTPPTSNPIVSPLPPIQLDPRPPVIDTTDLIPPPSSGPVVEPGPKPGPTIAPAQSKLFDPIAPKARNSGWVTDNDYRSTWINRGWAGTAGFRLDVGRNGRVEGCTITRSTGHAALDEATCALVTKRARFEAARNNLGETVSGSFSSAVRWQIPE